MSSTSLRRSGLYAAAVAVAGLELAIAWQALHPEVSDNYRAYYIDQTTTCLDQPVSGEYAFGRAVPFRDNAEEISTLRVCGWEGPAGDGLHAIGESSRLRFALPPGADDLVLTLELVAVDMVEDGQQPVAVMVNGVEAAALRVRSGTPQRFDIRVATLTQRPLEVELAYPEAILVDPQDSNTRKRSIKITMARVARSPQPMVAARAVTSAS